MRGPGVSPEAMAFLRKHGMVAEADIPHGGEAGLHGAPRQFRGLQQRDSRGFLLDGRNHIGFCTQAKWTWQR